MVIIKGVNRTMMLTGFLEVRRFSHENSLRRKDLSNDITGNSKY
jgi:hypothetical protein